MANEDYTPRFTIEISEELKKRIDNSMGQYGLRRAVVTIVLEDLVTLIENNGQIIIGAILDGAAKPVSIMPILAQAKKKTDL